MLPRLPTILWVFVLWGLPFTQILADIEEPNPLDTWQFMTASNSSDGIIASFVPSLQPTNDRFFTNRTLPSDTTKQKKLPTPGTALNVVASPEIDGLVLNETFSPGGYDFYLDFTQNWTPPADAQHYTVLVKEYPGRGVSIVVAIEVNGKQLVYRRMRPVYSAVHDLATAAANYLSGYLARGDHLRGVDADGNFIDVQRTDVTRQIKTPFDIF